MTVSKIDIPGEDAWVLGRLGTMLAKRLVHGSDDVVTRQALLRLVFGMQRLPLLIPDLCISLRAGFVSVELNSELFGLMSYTEDGHMEFRLQYFGGSSHCTYWSEFLSGDARRDAIATRLQDIQDVMADNESLSIEDHSVSGYVDEPPLDG